MGIKAGIVKTFKSKAVYFTKGSKGIFLFPLISAATHSNLPIDISDSGNCSVAYNFPASFHIPIFVSG
jgi:hypothetical protein